MFSLKRIVGPLTIIIAIFYAIAISQVYFTDSVPINYYHQAYYLQADTYSSEIAPEFGGIDREHNNYQIYPFSSNPFIDIFVTSFNILSGDLFSLLFCYQFLVFLSFILLPFSLYFFLRQFKINTGASTTVLLIALFESGGRYLGGFQGVYYYSEILPSLACAFSFFVFGLSVKIFKGHPRNVFISCCLLFLVLFSLSSFFLFAILILIIFGFLSSNATISPSTAKRIVVLVLLPLLLFSFILMPLIYYQGEYNFNYISESRDIATSTLSDEFDQTIFLLALLGVLTSVYYFSIQKMQFFNLIIILFLISILSLALTYFDRESIFTLGVSNLEYLIFFRVSLIAFSAIFFHYIYEIRNEFLKTLVPIFLLILLGYYIFNLQKTYVYFDEIEDKKYRVIETDESREIEIYKNLITKIDTNETVLFENTFYEHEYSYNVGSLTTSNYIPSSENFSTIYTFNTNFLDQKIYVPISNKSDLGKFIQMHAIDYVICFSDTWRQSFLEFGEVDSQNSSLYLIDINLSYFTFNSSILNKTENSYYINFENKSSVILPINSEPQIKVYVDGSEIDYGTDEGLISIDDQLGTKKVEIKYDMTNIEIFSQIITFIFIFLVFSVFLIDRLMKLTQKSISEIFREILQGMSRSKM